AGSLWRLCPGTSRGPPGANAPTDRAQRPDPAPRPTQHSGPAHTAPRAGTAVTQGTAVTDRTKVTPNGTRTALLCLIARDDAGSVNQPGWEVAACCSYSSCWRWRW